MATYQAVEAIGAVRTAPNGRLTAAVEVVAVFAACQLFLWQLSPYFKRGWLVIFGFMLISIVLRRVSLGRLGLRFASARPAGRWLATGLVCGAVPILGFGAIDGRLGLLLPDGQALLQFTGYGIWCLVQQFALQSYMHNRMLDAVPRPVVTSLLIAVVFGSLHLPNPVLTIATFVGGFAMGLLFVRYRNLWILAIGQALISTCIFVALPDAWHHRLRVGPGYFWWGIER